MQPPASRGTPDTITLLTSSERQELFERRLMDRIEDQTIEKAQRYMAIAAATVTGFVSLLAFFGYRTFQANTARRVEDSLATKLESAAKLLTDRLSTSLADANIRAAAATMKAAEVSDLLPHESVRSLTRYFSYKRNTAASWTA